MGKAFTEIRDGLEDAISHAKGKKAKAKEHQIESIDVKSIREKTGMSQQRFCATFGISIGTLRHWEQGLRSPRGGGSSIAQSCREQSKSCYQGD
jgi:putative transcriptional regulator